MSSIIKGNIRTRIFFGFMLVTLLSIIGVTVISYLVFKKNTETQNKERLRQTVEILMSSLDYAVSHTTVTEENIKPVLEKKILEISDINKQDIIIYNLQGKFLLSNKDNRFDSIEYIKDDEDNLTASYIPLLNNMLEPVAIVFFPFYHSDNTRLNTFNQYIQIMVTANIIIIMLGIWLSWRISDELTKNIRKISHKITQIDLNEELKPIRYYNDDEFTPLINSYNRTIRMIEEQKKLLFFKEKESAWREMAKHVANENKNPLTPMKLLIQNFERKFDKNDPDIDDRVKKLCASMVDQIDLMAKVAGAFSEFTKLPEKKNEVINVNNEISSLVRIFDDKNEIIFQSKQNNVLINFDKSFFQRIMTNLILNAQQAKNEKQDFFIKINLELLNKKISLTIEDNGNGIPEDKLEKIFEPNFTTKSSGTGLGLAMVKRMIEDYKGEISIRSKEGKGTTFMIILPTNM